MLGRRDEALPLYRQIRHTRTSETEEMAVRIAAERLDAPMSDEAKVLLRAANAVEGGRPVLREALRHAACAGDGRGRFNALRRDVHPER